MKSALIQRLFTRRALSFALLFSALSIVALVFATASSSRATGQQRASAAGAVGDDAGLGLAEFRQAVGGSITPVIIELKGDPGVIRKVKAEEEGGSLSMEQIFANAQALAAEQDAFRASLAQRGVRALMRENDVTQIDGSVRRIQYRFTYLLNGFVAYVATEDLDRLRGLPEVAVVSEPEPTEFHLDRAIDYSLGTQTNPADRRTAVYGATQEFSPATGDAAHPETPRTTKVDGFEGQNINIAIIDSGVDYRHPMFGGIGQQTPLPRVSGQPENAMNNKKVIYFYAFNEPVGDPTDDFGHGTLVASTAAGYTVDGNTPPRPGYGTGRDNTGVGPTINGAQLFGTAPQARIMAYKVCGPAPNCFGDIPLSVEDAASPFTLVTSGNTGPVPVPKPVADVINLSLGSTTGDPAAANSRACNNAALAGSIVVASAGNSGPGLGTVGNPGAATLAIGVAASLDPGSVAGSDVLAAGQVTDPRLPAAPGPTPEVGATSNQNAPQPGERQGIRIFPVAGGGPLPAESNPAQPVDNNTGSLSAHYVFVDRRNAADPVPTTVGNRIALVKFTGAFAGAANTLAAQPVPPAAILLITNVESATAVQVIRGIPTFTISENDGNYLIDRALTGDPGDGNNDIDVPQGTISELPLRLAETISLPAFNGVMAGFSSRGPNDHPNANFRVIKPDVTAPGVGVVGAATVEGIPDEAVGLASTSGYTSANGTSFSGPITAGAMCLIRQRVREQLNLDSTDPMQRLKRYDTVTVARALLQNSATNLRSGLGVPQGDGTATASINDMGSGHINVFDALTANSIMVAPTLLLADANPAQAGNQAEFTPPTNQAPTLETGGNLKVFIPTASFGSVPVVRLNDTIVRTQEVIIRDVGSNGAGGGTYNLSVQDNRSTNNPAFRISTTAAADSATPITSVDVPAGGQVSFFVRVEADGPGLSIDGEEFQWYVTATQNSTARKLRMPFYFRAVNAVFPNAAAPVQGLPQQTEQPAGTCPTDKDGNYIINWTYSTPAHTGFRVQEATMSQSIFFDDAEERLMPNAIGTTVVTENSRWRDAGIPGTPQTPPQWTSEPNPDTGTLAYFIPNAQAQNHSLTMRNPITLPPTGVTLSFTSRESITNNTNFGFVEVSTDGINYFTLLRVTGTFSGTREVDLSGFSGQTVRLRFRYQSVTGSLSGAQGWFVENIRISSDNFRTIATPDAAARSLAISGRFDGTYQYRVAALYANPNPLDPGTTIVGPYSNIRCVTVTDNPPPAPMPGSLRFGEPSYAVGENGGSVVVKVVRENGSDGRVSVNYATSNGSATAGSDYTATSGTLTFEPGEIQKEFSVAITDDTADEDDETVNLTLTNPTDGAVLGVPPAAVLTIIDNETPAAEPGTLRFSAATYSVSEDAGAATITVTRSGGSGGAVSVSYSTSDGSASTNSDYTPTSGVLTFADGELTKSFNVPVVDDPSVEPDETVLLSISNPTGGATLGSPSSATLTIFDTDRAGPPAQLLNISTRLRVQGGERVGIGGFIVTGSSTKRILVRGIGPSLSSNGTPVEGRLQDPAIELFDGNGISITSNNDWKDSPERADIEASGLAPSNDKEAAIARTVPPGAYTAVLSGADGSDGIGLVEAYDRDQGGNSEMANISTRGFVDTGDNVLIGGFIAGARSGATNVVVRAIGPSLGSKGVSGALADPQVQLINANGMVVDQNDDWKVNGDEAEVTARGLAPQDDRESAAVHTVAPGNYTVVVRGKGETTGVGLVEIYNVR
jgi:hypothetical protein